jgi:hypothetical protein
MTTPSELGAVATLILGALYAGRQLADRDPRPSPDGRVTAPPSVAWAGAVVVSVLRGVTARAAGGGVCGLPPCPDMNPRRRPIE